MSSKEVEENGSWTPRSNFGFVRSYDRSISPCNGDCERNETRDTYGRGSRRPEDAGRHVVKLRTELSDELRILCDSEEKTPKHTNRSAPPTSSDLKKRIDADDEARENGAFAAEAGLSFDSDNGDKINDLALYNLSLSRSCDGDVTSGIWDRLVTYSMSMSSSNEYRRQNKPSHHTSSSIEKDTVSIEAEGNTQFTVEAGPDRSTIHDHSLCSASRSQSFSTGSSFGCSSSFDYTTYLRHRQADEKATEDVTEGDADSLATNDAVALRDEMSKRISPCTKMIRGYADVQNRKTLPTKQPPHSSRDLPTIPEVDQHEMERKLHDLASMLSSDWKGQDYVAPVLARRIRDFQFAREKRKKKYGGTHSIGIFGLYEHLSKVKVDVQWAEDAAWRRIEGKPYLTWADFEAEKKEHRRRPYFTFIIVSVW
ncbi:hypothetical protein THAOC_01335 [Thalassiosira oceanica]|uniref:Uncharacterized protein n=1 Tax=Thalassiosira oceanica TaxID=159749 RepID=K0TN55_THAOC|nr:hypothetical protein THAOC_01335 [Thalassiosira oceanica]|eukprot:EJK76881.1 hypothetical protein THAOC_01335 [Thalassiosira oceanica]